MLTSCEARFCAVLESCGVVVVLLWAALGLALDFLELEVGVTEPEVLSAGVCGCAAADFVEVEAAGVAAPRPFGRLGGSGASGDATVPASRLSSILSGSLQSSMNLAVIFSEIESHDDTLAIGSGPSQPAALLALAMASAACDLQSRVAFAGQRNMTATAPTIT